LAEGFINISKKLGFREMLAPKQNITFLLNLVLGVPPFAKTL